MRVEAMAMRVAGNEKGEGSGMEMVMVKRMAGE
jgi:hypothetical protein